MASYWHVLLTVNELEASEKVKKTYVRVSVEGLMNLKFHDNVESYKYANTSEYVNFEVLIISLCLLESGYRPTFLPITMIILDFP